MAMLSKRRIRQLRTELKYNKGIIVAIAFLLVIICGMGMEALPLSCVAGWIGMFILEVPLLRKKLAEMKAEQ